MTDTLNRVFDSIDQLEADHASVLHQASQAIAQGQEPEATPREIAAALRELVVDRDAFTDVVDRLMQARMLRTEEQQLGDPRADVVASRTALEAFDAEEAERLALVKAEREPLERALTANQERLHRKSEIHRGLMGADPAYGARVALEDAEAALADVEEKLDTLDEQPIPRDKTDRRRQLEELRDQRRSQMEQQMAAVAAADRNPFASAVEE